MTVERTTADPNKHVVDFLRYYCDPMNALDYAVMLRGPWGSGKTFLINTFLADRLKAGPTKHLYVSLYGLSSVRQIDEAFSRQLHPILSSKGMKIVTALAKGALKGAFKIDLTSDGKDSVTIEPQLPDLNVLEYFKTPKECLLVFDDLERCSVPLPEVLGYINAFVEHEGFKVIILANEAEIIRRNIEIDRYNEIKEKLIGQTLEVQSTAAYAITTFLTLIRNDETQRFLEKNVSEILALYTQSGTNNLRLLKQSLWDFERLAVCFSTKHWANEEAVSILFRVVLALSFQVRRGELKEDQFAEIQISTYERFLSSKKREGPTIAEALEKQYPATLIRQ